ncbi:phytosulfokine receptor 1-like [Macadamia integrifolia]|uniref:phytosulfokine receptor 1-like n=1 Tax=Macadamia integrifolia TaxID=60698 RepID=UPI001C4F0FF8|nr:phytosulfokine receptor 1-like [Macadamia integrifolia]
MGVGDFLVVIFFIGFCFQVLVLSSQNVTCNPKDLRALEGLLKGLESGISGWGSDVSSDCCNWTGVNCSSSAVGVKNSTDSGKRVVGLELGKKRLKGNLSESLGGLDQLRFLNLSRNFFKGTLPFNLFHLQNLRVLDLSYNYFSGLLPRESDLPALEYLDISENLFEGAIDTGICDNSTQIRVLNLSMNYFIGKFPLRFGNCSSLQHLCLNSNYLYGNLPQDLFLLAKLKKLYLQDNRISGSLSAMIGNLTNLIELDISFNNFSGPIPEVFSRLPKLQHFIAHSNEFVGRLPISLSNSSTLISLNLRNNSLGGLFNLNCSAMASLTSLDVGSNQFYGPILDILSSCKKLRTINLARNNINSQIPECFKNLHVLSYLSLSNTSLHNLSAAFGVLQQFRNLTTLVLTLNFHEEEMPSDASFHFRRLTTLIIPNCGLRGSIPTWLSNSTNLQLMDLSWNQLSGTIPDWLGELKSLFYLDLSNNSLSGVIPKSLTSMESLISRNILFEEPSPDFPFFIKRNQTGRALQYNQIGSFPPSLDLSYNMLTGPIWPDFGNLKKLIVLDLKQNFLSGHIPSELSMMKDLETLDLSCNNLSGTIPDSLVNLSFLSKFSVAYNQLSGRIPSEGQFLTFPNSSFEGNKDLCERSAPCTVDQNPSARTPKQARKKRIIVGTAVGIGVGSIFILVLVVLIISRPRSRTRDDPEKEGIDATSKDLEQLGSRLLVLFHKESNKELSVDDLLKSTNNFDQANIIGCGGFGLVYEATLPDGKKVAIKRLSGDGCGQMEREFQAEVETLSKAQHGNLVLLQGYCMYGNDRLLIYSYMKNGSLDYWLHEKLDGASSLDWETRLRIAQGAARGLVYLHQSCQPHILHRDIKSSNILLDENFEAHLADFGLARLILPYDTHVTTDLVGTLGYIPPEYCQASVATYKGDVYSFGVVLLELLTGKRPVDMCKPEGCRDLISWVLRMKKEKRESEVFDPLIYGKQNDKELLRVLEIACICLDESPKLRPSTQQIVLWLDNVDVDG